MVMAHPFFSYCYPPCFCGSPIGLDLAGIGRRINLKYHTNPDKWTGSPGTLFELGFWAWKVDGLFSRGFLNEPVHDFRLIIWTSTGFWTKRSVFFRWINPSQWSFQLRNLWYFMDFCTDCFWLTDMIPSLKSIRILKITKVHSWITIQHGQAFSNLYSSRLAFFLPRFVFDHLHV